MLSATSVIGIREPGALDLVQTLLRQGISVRIRVSGDSMRPLFNGGETVELSPFAGGIPKLGDILFIRGLHGNPLVHRLIWRHNRNGALYLLTKGDACASFDVFFSAECVLGRVEQIISNDPAKTTISLRTPFMRLQSNLIVIRTLSCHALRKLKKSIAILRRPLL